MHSGIEMWYVLFVSINPRLWDWPAEEIEASIPGDVFWPAFFWRTLGRVQGHPGLNSVCFLGLEWSTLKVHAWVDFNGDINCSIRLAFQGSSDFRMRWVICACSACMWILAQARYRKIFTGTNIEKWTFSVLSPSGCCPKGRCKGERPSYFWKHWTLNGRKYSKTILWPVDLQRAYVPTLQPSREKTERKLSLLLLGEELPSPRSIHFNDKNKTPEMWDRPNHWFLHTLLHMVNPENVPLNCNTRTTCSN